MDNNKSYITGFIITVFFLMILMIYKTNKENNNIYTPSYVDSLHLQMHIKDSTIRHFNTYIPFGSPLDSLIISSDFGSRVHPISKHKKFHEGLDLRGGYSDTVYCTAAGIVMEARRKGGYGKHVMINHNNGYQTVYAHLSQILVKKGQHVTDTTPIGKVGNTGISTGCHLHYEIIKDGEKINPEDLLYKEIDKL